MALQEHGLFSTIVSASEFSQIARPAWLEYQLRVAEWVSHEGLAS